MPVHLLETRSCIAQAVVKLYIAMDSLILDFPSLPPECWDYRHGPPSPSLMWFLKSHYLFFSHQWLMCIYHVVFFVLFKWVNNLEVDSRYNSWPSSLQELLRPTFPGVIRQIRKNLHNMVSKTPYLLPITVSLCSVSSFPSYVECSVFSLYTHSVQTEYVHVTAVWQPVLLCDPCASSITEGSHWATLWFYVVRLFS